MEATEQAILQGLHAIIDRAQAAGLVATITLEHQQPLAMGNYKMVPAVRPVLRPALPDHTIIPRRTIRMDFTHPTIGDTLMVPKVEQAMRELIEAGVDRHVFLASNGIAVYIKGLPMLDQPSLTLNLCGIDMSAGDDGSVVVEVSEQGVRIPGIPVERRAPWPDPDKVRFSTDRPDPYNASLRVTDTPKRRRTD